MYKIILADGTELKDLELNGNNFIPESIIDSNIFDGNLSKIVVMDNEGKIKELNNCKVIFAKVGDKLSFILIEKTQEEIEKENLYQLMADLTEVVLLGGA